MSFSESRHTAYVDPQFFYETVAPLLSVGTTTLIGISTLTSEINFYSELFCLKFMSSFLTAFLCSTVGSFEGQAERTAHVYCPPDTTGV